MRTEILEARIIERTGHARIFSHPIPRDICFPVLKSRGRICLRGRQMSIALAIHLLENPDQITPKRATPTCNTPFCQNPHHWVFTPPPAPLPAPVPTTATLQDAIDLLDRYLCYHPTDQIDFKHDLLIDLPPDLLLQALTLANKEHLI